MPSNFDNFLEFCLKIARKRDTDDEEETLTPFYFAETRSLPGAGRPMASVPLSQTAVAALHALDKPQQQQERKSQRQQERKLRLLQRLRLRITMNFQQRNKVFTAAKKFEEDEDDETALECFLFCLEGEGE